MQPSRDEKNPHAKNNRAWLMPVGAAVLLILLLLLQPGASGLAAPHAQSTIALPIIFKEWPAGSPTVTPTGTQTSTATVTSTATQTVTPTGTLPTTTATSVTPSPTATATTPIPPTVTSTQPTVTGTPPTATQTPTATGTITPNPGVVISVSPSSAKVNELFTFIVTLTNSGSAPATNAIFSDSFPTTIDINTVTIAPNIGTITKATHTVTIALGVIDPGDTISIVITAKVNSTAKTTETLSNIVTLTYDSNKSKTASVSYRVEAGSTLPGTGEGPLEPSAPRGVDVSLLFLAGSLALAGLVTLWYAIWARTNQPGAPRWLPLAGVAAVAAGLLCGLAGVGLWPAPALAPQEATAPPAWLSAPTQAAPPREELAGFAILPAFPASGETEYVFQTPNAPATLPEYPVPTPTTAPAAPGEAPADTSAVVRLEIPSLGLDAVVKYVPFTENTWLIGGLREEIAWLGNTSWPGLGGNTVLAAHVTVRNLGNGPFRYLDELKNGDAIYVETENYRYIYRVREQAVVGENDLWVTQPTDNSQLTLITCTDWSDEFKLYLRRLAVFADLESSEPLAVQNSH